MKIKSRHRPSDPLGLAGGTGFGAPLAFQPGQRQLVTLPPVIVMVVACSPSARQMA
jgi:hypothetical protein